MPSCTVNSNSPPAPPRIHLLRCQSRDPVLPVDDYAWVRQYAHVTPQLAATYSPPVFRATPYATNLNSPATYYGTAVLKE